MILYCFYVHVSVTSSQRKKVKKKKHYNYKYKKKKQGGVESILPPKGCFAAQQSASRLISEVILITVAVAVQ